MSRFVRASKFRHVFGTGVKPEQQYLDLKTSRNAWDSNLIKANPYFIAVCWEAAGGGAFAVLDQKAVGKQPQPALFSGHKLVVLDVDFNPFNDHIVASCSEDARVNVYQIPQDGLTSQAAPAMKLEGHQRKVGQISFHPTAENVIASSSGDLSVKLWDITAGKEKCQVLGPTDQIQSFVFNADGNMMAVASKDKKIRVYDVRANKETGATAGHDGVKPQRLLWLGDSNRIASTGFSKQSDRQIHIRDTTNLGETLSAIDVDTSSGVLMPFFDEDTNMMYIAGKGDGNIRYFECVDEKPFVFPLSEFQSKDPQRGVCFLPKRAVDVTNIEISKAFKCTPNAIEPISFTVPRKSDLFQTDLFPDTKGAEPSMTLDEYFSGATCKPLKKISMEGGFVAGAKKQVEFKAAEPPGQKKEKDLENPQNEKELREAWQKRGDEMKILNDKIAQRDVTIRGLELKLKELQS